MNSKLYLIINGWSGHSVVLDSGMIFLAEAAFFILGLIVAACLTFLLWKKQWRQLILFFTSCVISLVVLKLAELAFPEARPFVTHAITPLIEHVPDQSFPSSHTTGSMAIALSLMVFTRFRYIGASLAGLAVLIGFSRIFVGVHYPLDILGGIATALVGVGITLGIKRLTAPRFESAPHGGNDELLQGRQTEQSDRE